MDFRLPGAPRPVGTGLECGRWVRERLCRVRQDQPQQRNGVFGVWRSREESENQ